MADLETPVAGGTPARSVSEGGASQSSAPSSPEHRYSRGKNRPASHRMSMPISKRSREASEAVADERDDTGVIDGESVPLSSAPRPLSLRIPRHLSPVRQAGPRSPVRLRPSPAATIASSDQSISVVSPRLGTYPSALMQWQHSPRFNSVQSISSVQSVSTFGVLFSPLRNSEPENPVERASVVTDEQTADDESRQPRRTGWCTSTDHVVESVHLSLSVVITTGVIWTLVSTSMGDGMWSRLLLLFHLPVYFAFQMLALKRCVAARFCLPTEMSDIENRLVRAPDSFGESLPTFTVIVPVYTQLLEAGLRDTICKVQKAIATYKMRGGSGSLLVCDDGLHMVSEAEKTTRIDFYASNDVAFIARPKDTTGVNTREPRVIGLYSHAEGLNYCLNILHRVSDKLRGATATGVRLSGKDAMHQVWSCKEYQSEFLYGGHGHLGELVMVIDTLMEIPPECLYEFACELLEHPSVSYAAPHTSYIRERTQTLSQRAESYACAQLQHLRLVSVYSGSALYLGGSHSVLRWKALRRCATPLPSRPLDMRFWNPYAILSDLELSLRLQAGGCRGHLFTLQWSAYKRIVKPGSIGPRLFLCAIACADVALARIRCGRRLLQPSWLQFLTSSAVDLSDKLDMLVIGTLPLVVLLSMLSLVTSILISFADTGISIYAPLTFAGAPVVVFLLMGLIFAFSRDERQTSNPDADSKQTFIRFVTIAIALSLPWTTALGCARQLLLSSRPDLGLDGANGLHRIRLCSMSLSLCAGLMLAVLVALLFTVSGITISWLICAGCSALLLGCSVVIAVF